MASRGGPPQNDRPLDQTHEHHAAAHLQRVLELDDDLVSDQSKDEQFDGTRLDE